MDYDDIRLEGDGHSSYYIGGVQVQFPFQPYPSQLGMMCHMIRALDRAQHTMIESPTGSGKSLALLCAVLSWRRAYAARRRRAKANSDQIVTRFARANPLRIVALIDCAHILAGLGVTYAEDSKKPAPADSSDEELELVQVPPAVNDGPALEPTGNDGPAPEPTSNDGPAPEPTGNAPPVPEPSSSATPVPEPSKSPASKGSITIEVDADSAIVRAALKCRTQVIEHILQLADAQTPTGLAPEDIATLRDARRLMETGVPRIYFGARTHKQVSQLVAELRKKTPYRLRAAVLSSRTQSCINPGAKEAWSVDEACRELLDDSACDYFNRADKLAAHESVLSGGPMEIWDVEDLVALGREKHACPYFAARSLATSAPLVFCPYNYIIDPSIRSAVDIKLEGNVVILDEAHNIENAARDAGSFEITDLQLLQMVKKCDELIGKCVMPGAHATIKTVTETLANWLQRSDLEYEHHDHESKTAVWPAAGCSIDDLFGSLGLTLDTVTELEAAHALIEEHIKEMRARRLKDRAPRLPSPPPPPSPPLPESGGKRKRTPEPPEPKCLSLAAMRDIQRLIWVLKKALSPSEYSGDYRLAATRRANREPQAGQHSRARRRRNNQGEYPESINTLSLWAMNPGVVTAEIARLTRTVVLTSGTLSPLESYASELQMEFGSTLEANHVIDPQRFLATTIECGPGGEQIVAKHGTTALLSFQDSVGAAISTIAAKCPDGMLVFAPSYTLLDTLFARWDATGHMEDIKMHKDVFVEPPGSSSDQFANIMAEYRAILARRGDGGRPAARGAIMFAVYRGKISEGIDFPDHDCRTVVNIGIPYPAFKDVQITLKRQYNDSRAADSAHPLLSGAQWYSIQAFRALNQALGRCLRHKDDWGAIIMLEARFVHRWNIARLSKWIRNHMYVYHDFASAERDLDAFYRRHIASDLEAACRTMAVSAPETAVVVYDSDDDDFASPARPK